MVSYGEAKDGTLKSNKDITNRIILLMVLAAPGDTCVFLLKQMYRDKHKGDAV